MTMLEEPPDENETFENLDEALDDTDAVGGVAGIGPEGSRDIGDLAVDHVAMKEVGADLADPEQMSMLEGGMDDPDGVDSTPRLPGADVEGWDVDPVEADRFAGEGQDVGAEGDAISDDLLVDVPDLADDPELELLDMDPAELEQMADDAPGPDSARW